MLEETAPPIDAPADSPSTESGSMYVRVFKKVLPLLPIVAGTMIADQFSTNLLIPIKVQFFAPADVYAASGGCSASAVASLPAACIDAQNKAEVVTASLNGAQTLIGLCILPLLGRYSDAYGRRPLLIWSSLVSLLSIFVLWMTQALGLSLYAYFASEFLARFQVFTIIFLAILSDKTDITERAVAFSLIIGLLALSALVAGIAFALLSGGALSYSGLIAVGAISLCFVLVYVWMVLPESLPVSSRRPYNFVAGDLIPTRTISLLRATPGLFRLTITLVLQAVAMYGLQAMRAAYAQNTYGLTPQDLAILGAIMGISIVVVQMVIQPLLSRFMSDTKVILVAGLAAAVPLVFSSFGVDKGSFYLLTAISMLSTILFPMLSVALSQRVSPRRQGQLDAATTAVTNFIGAISTVVFGSALYPVNHGVPFLVGAIFLALSSLSVLIVPALSDSEAEAIRNDSDDIADLRAGDDQSSSNLATDSGDVELEEKGVSRAEYNAV